MGQIERLIWSRVTSLLARQEAGRVAGFSILLLTVSSACAVWGIDHALRSHEHGLSMALADRAAVLQSLQSTAAQERAHAADLADAHAQTTEQTRGAQLAEIYRIAAAVKVRAIGADVGADRGDPSIDVRVRGSYPDAKLLMAQVMASNDRVLVRNFTARRLASGAEREFRILFQIAAVAAPS